MAATASFGASTFLGSQIVKLSGDQAHIHTFMLATNMIYFELTSSERAVRFICPDAEGTD
jgi:hypothetical protein